MPRSSVRALCLGAALLLPFFARADVPPIPDAPTETVGPAEIAAPAKTTPAPESGPESAPAPLAAAYREATVETAKTSIYIGAVTLRMPPFVRTGDTYASTYSAKVFPFFFYNEAGRLSINLTDDDLRHLEAGERVYFKGEAFNEQDEPRRVEGQADPADARSGRLKVRVWVSKNIELIFNTTYRFTGTE